MNGSPGSATAYIGLGSNLGDREAHLAYAVRRLADAGELGRLSSVYESEPVGHVQQPRFLNMVVAVRTLHTPPGLLALAHAIEEERHRERSFRGAPRTLDIDILLHGDRVVEEPGLELPHPRMAERAFVLVPLLEVDRHVTEPGTGRPYMERLLELAGGPPDLHTLGLRTVMAGEELLR